MIPSRPAVATAAPESVTSGHVRFVHGFPRLGGRVIGLAAVLNARLTAGLTAVLIAVLIAGAPAHAQPGAERTVRIVVPFAAGGPTDVAARVLAPLLAERLKQPVVVENKLGATGAIGAEAVARSPADGTTILFGTSSIMAASPNLTAVPRFDPVRDFAPVSLVATIDNILVVHPSVPANSVKELVAYAKAHPNRLSYASSGIGSTYHLGAELFRAQTGIEWIHVPYKGAAPAAQDVLAGHVQVMFDAYSSAVPNMKAGRVRALGIASLERHPELPDLPTIAESGVPGYETAIWLALFLPRETPQPMVDRLRDALVGAMQAPGVRERFSGLGMQPVTSTPQALGALLQRELAKWGKVVRDAGIKPE
jgi:tripartite-type tricarboxylate transporter receptor subunit TctC